jgi:hypothetical protein
MQKKRFVLKVVDSAKSKQYWNVLGYEPHEAWTLRSLEKFRELIEDFTEEFIEIDNYEDWLTGKPDRIEKCSIHDIYLHWAGCVICNDK